jgi:hypothetical protein
MGTAWSPMKHGRVRAYRCRGQHAAGRCPRPAFALADPLLERVEATFFGLLGGDLIARPAGDEAAGARLEQLQRRRERLIAARNQYRDDPDIQAALPPRDYAEGLAVRHRQIDDLDRTIGDELASQPAITADATSLRLQWPAIDVPTRRRMFHAALGTVVVRAPAGYQQHGVPLGHRARVLLPADLPPDLPRPGRNPVALHSFAAFDDPACPWVALG